MLLDYPNIHLHFALTRSKDFSEPFSGVYQKHLGLELLGSFFDFSLISLPSQQASRAGWAHSCGHTAYFSAIFFKCFCLENLLNLPYILLRALAIIRFIFSFCF